MILLNKKTIFLCALIAFHNSFRAQIVAKGDTMSTLTECYEQQTETHIAQAVADSLQSSPRSQFPRVTTRQWLWGIGGGNILDTYLSPFTYKGTDFSLLYQTERLAHWGRNNVTVKSHYNTHVCYANSPTDDGKALDAEFSALGGWHYNWHLSAWRIGLGGLLEASGGFTYNTRNSNNPAQARLGTAVLVSAIVDYQFRFFSQKATASVEVNAQMLGVQFAPEYGQSYYEIFSLGHSDGVVHLTHLGNCPTMQAISTLTIPIKRAKLTFGYMADIRQSKLGGLKRHAWRNSFMLGYTRQFKRL